MIRRTRKIKIDLCLNDDLGTSCLFKFDDECVFYDKAIPDDYSSNDVKKPEYCHVTRIIIEEEI